MLPSLFKNLARDESGAILSAELVIILTVAVLAMIVGLSEVAAAVNCELFDISRALCSLNQSYATPSFSGCRPKGGWFRGSRFSDVSMCAGFCQQIGVAGGYASGHASDFAGDFAGSSIVGGPSIIRGPVAAPLPSASTTILSAPTLIGPAPDSTTVCPPVPAHCECPPALKSPGEAPKPVPEVTPAPEAKPAEIKPEDTPK